MLTEEMYRKEALQHIAPLNAAMQAFKRYPEGQDDTIVKKFKQECHISQLKHPKL